MIQEIYLGLQELKINKMRFEEAVEVFLCLTNNC